MLCQIDCVTFLDFVECLHSACRGESPAGTTASLVLNGIDDALFSPIDAVGHRLELDGSSSDLVSFQSQVSLSEFLRSQVHELVLGEVVGVIGVLIKVLDHVIVVVVDSESIPFLIRLRVLLSVLLLPLEETLNNFIREGC